MSDYHFIRRPDKIKPSGPARWADDSLTLEYFT